MDEPSGDDVPLDNAGGGSEAVIIVDIEREDNPKPFLGGYRHRKTGIEYHHASTQTWVPKKPKVYRILSTKAHRNFDLVACCREISPRFANGESNDLLDPILARSRRSNKATRIIPRRNHRQGHGGTPLFRR